MRFLRSFTYILSVTPYVLFFGENETVVPRPNLNRNQISVRWLERIELSVVHLIVCVYLVSVSFPRISFSFFCFWSFVVVTTERESCHSKETSNFSSGKEEEYFEIRSWPRWPKQMQEAMSYKCDRNVLIYNHFLLLRTWCL